MGQQLSQHVPTRRVWIDYKVNKDDTCEVPVAIRDLQMTTLISSLSTGFSFCCEDGRVATDLPQRDSSQ